MVRGVLPGHLRPKHKAKTRYNGPYEVCGSDSPFTINVRLIGTTGDGVTVHLMRVFRFAGDQMEVTSELVEAAHNDAAQYEVEEITRVRVHEGQVQCHVSWLGFSSDEDSWEPAKSLHQYVPKLVLESLAADTSGNAMIAEEYEALKSEA